MQSVVPHPAEIFIYLKNHCWKVTDSLRPQICFAFMLIYRCEFISHLLFIWECHWTDNASVQPTAASVWSKISLIDSVSVWRPACLNLPVLWDTLVYHSNEKLIEGCMNRLKTLQLMQIMTHRMSVMSYQSLWCDLSLLSEWICASVKHTWVYVKR